MKILVDADAIPLPIREILFRAAERTRIPLILVANVVIKHPKSELISAIVAAAGPDEADDVIAGMVEPGNLVITSDIPLAARAIEKGGTVIDTRGALYTSANIKERLSMRNLMEELRNTGIDTGGPAPFSAADRHSFANQLDKFLVKLLPV